MRSALKLCYAERRCDQDRDLTQEMVRMLLADFVLLMFLKQSNKRVCT